MRRIVIPALMVALAAPACSNRPEPDPTAGASATSTTTTTPTLTTTPTTITTTSTHPPATTSTAEPPSATFAIPSADGGTWKSWSTSNRVKVRGLAVAPNDEVWAATDGGVVRWDRTGSYTVFSDPAWPDPEPHSIASTPNGDLWLGFHIDVIRVTPTATVRYEFTPSGNTGGGIELAVGPDGGIWAGAGQFGVQRFDGTEWQVVVSDLPGRGDLDTLAVDSLGRPWMGSYWSGLWLLDQGELRLETARTTRVVRAGADRDVWYKVDNGHGGESTVVHLDAATGSRTEYDIDATNVWDIASTEDGAYVCTNPLSDGGTESYGLWRLRDGKVEPVPGSWDEPRAQVLGLAVGGAGTVWLGGQNGVWSYDGKSEHRYLTDTFAGFTVNFITTGDAGSPVWSGDCHSSSIYTADRWSVLPEAQDQRSECDTLIDSDGRFWIAGEAGIGRLDGNQWVVDDSDGSGVSWHDLYPPCSSEACEEGRWSLASADGVWAGMLGVENGLWRYEGGAWNRTSDTLPAGSGGVADLAVGEDDTLWVATSNGVHHLVEDGWVSHLSGDGPPADLQAIATGGDRIWTRTYCQVAQFDGETWFGYSLEDEWCEDRILMVDPQGAAWLPTRTGVKRFNGTFVSDLELPDSSETHSRAMTIDATGAWWMTSGGRLYRWTP